MLWPPRPGCSIRSDVASPRPAVTQQTGHFRTVGARQAGEGDPQPSKRILHRIPVPCARHPRPRPRRLRRPRNEVSAGAAAAAGQSEPHFLRAGRGEAESISCCAAETGGDVTAFTLPRVSADGGQSAAPSRADGARESRLPALPGEGPRARSPHCRGQRGAELAPGACAAAAAAGLPRPRVSPSRGTAVVSRCWRKHLPGTSFLA